jgi:putative salt-induced outer membrane protein YdiY
MTKLLLCITVSISFFAQITSADIVVLSSGEQLHVTILEQTDTTIHVRHAILGDFLIDVGDVSSIDQAQELGEASPAVEDANESEHAKKSLWNQNARLGFGYQESQKTTADLSISYHADQTIEEHQTSIDVSYRFSESEDERTANRLTTILGNKWFQSNSRWDIFTNLQYDWAEYQSWDQRLLGDVGVEFELYKQTKGDSSFIVSTRVGSGFRKEFNSDDDDVIPEGLLGLNIRWSISERQKFTADSTWYPDYEDASNYRLVSNAAWNIKLHMENDLSFSVGVHHEFNSVVDTGINHADLQITAGIAYAF